MKKAELRNKEDEVAMLTGTVRYGGGGSMRGARGGGADGSGSGYRW
jgi:hypothetical protein